MSMYEKKGGRVDDLNVIPNRWSLSRAETQIVDMMAREGLTGAEVAKRIHISIKTVATYGLRIKEKMGVQSTLAAVLMWDREMHVRAPAVKPITVLRAMLGREPNKQERELNFLNWERSPELYRELSDKTRAALVAGTGEIDNPAMIERLQEWFATTELKKEHWDSLMTAVRGPIS